MWQDCSPYIIRRKATAFYLSWNSLYRKNTRIHIPRNRCENFTRFYAISFLYTAYWKPYGRCGMWRVSQFSVAFILAHKIITMFCCVVVLDDPFCETYFAASSLLQRLYFYLSIVIKELCFSQINAWTIAKCCLIKCYLRPCFFVCISF